TLTKGVIVQPIWIFLPQLLGRSERARELRRISHIEAIHREHSLNNLQRVLSELVGGRRSRACLPMRVLVEKFMSEARGDHIAVGLTKAQSTGNRTDADAR